MHHVYRCVRDGLTNWIPPNDSVKVPHKLTDDEIIAVRERCKPADGSGPESYGSIGSSFGITGQTVARIARGDLRASCGGPIEGTDYPKRQPDPTHPPARVTAAQARRA